MSNNFSNSTNRQPAKKAGKKFSRRAATVCALLLQATLCFNILVPTFASTNEQDAAQLATESRKVAPEVKTLIKHYQENGRKDRLSIILSMRAEASNELKNELLSVDETYVAEKGSRVPYKLAGEIALDDIERIAAREDVLRISLDTRKREWETGLQDAEVASAIINQKVAPEIQELVENKSDEALDSIVRVIIQTNDAPLQDLKAEARVVGKEFTAFDGMVAELPLKQVKELAIRDDVAQISLDNETSASFFKLKFTTGKGEVIARDPSLTGAGVGIAILDSGVDSAMAPNRVVANVNFVTGETGTKDLNGHGTMVASLAAGDGEKGSGGTAPGANIINVRVLGREGTGLTSDAIRGLEWAIQNKSTYNIRVINMSLGARSTASFFNDPLCRAVRKAVGAGIVVVASAGNFGQDAFGRTVYGSVTSPGNEPLAITVGAVNLHNTTKRSDDTVAKFSSRGPTLGWKTNSTGQKVYDFVIKPDLVAPGNRLVGSKPSAGGRLTTLYPQIEVEPGMMQLSGTSMAAPVVAGTAALIIQRNPNLTPQMVRAILQFTAQPIRNTDVVSQGAGLLNIDAAVRLAVAINTNAAWSEVGSPIMSGAMPAKTIQVGGENVSRSGIIFFNGWNIYGGDELFRKMQFPYQNKALWYAYRLYQPVEMTRYQAAPPAVLTPGVMFMTYTVLYNNGTLNNTTSGITLPQGITLSEGFTLSQGVTMPQGITLSEGITMSEGFTILEGITMSEGVTLSEGIVFNNSLNVVLNGEQE